MVEIVTGRAVTPRRCEEMKELLFRELTDSKATADGQTRGFTGPALPPGAKLWSKAGWTSQTRHDAAYVELPGGKKFVLVTFTVDHANEREIIPTVARRVIASLQDASLR
jgi:beta-lactamase class A